MDYPLVATRQGFGDAITKLVLNDTKIIALTADLAESLRMLQIKEQAPAQFIDTGVAEANMVGIAAGLAIGGYIPVATTFAIFLTRAYDHIRVQICQNNLHAIMVGSHGGVSNGLDGASAQALEDIAYMRALPNMTVVFPFDANQVAQALPAMIAGAGPMYLRLYREPTPVFTGIDEPFVLGQAQIRQVGSDISLIATGPHVAFALEAAEQLASDGISAEVVGVHTIAPLDRETICGSAQKTKRVITIEDHGINGGLGSAVAEVLSEQCPTPLRRIAVRQFGESGPYHQLIAKLGIDTTAIVREARAMVAVQ